MNQRFINGEARIGINDLIPFFNQGHKSEENSWFSTRDNNHFLARAWDSARVSNVFSNGFAQLGKAGRRSIVSPAGLYGLYASLDHVGGRIKVRLTDFQMDDFLTLGFQLAGLGQYVKSTLRAQ